MKRSSRIARWLLGRWFSSAEVEEALADLDELRRVRLARRGPLSAAVWYWIHLLLYPVAEWLERMKRGTAPATRRARLAPAGEDAVQAIRSLVRRPWFGILAASILAVAVGANAAIFSVVKSVLVDGLPVTEPDRLMMIWKQGIQTGDRARMTPGNYTDVTGLGDVFESLAAFSGTSATLLDAGEPEVLRGGRVTSGYFATLGVQPLAGRTFRPEEDEPGGAPVVVLGHRLWLDRFGGDRSVVGRTINLDGTLFEVVGVLRPGLYPATASTAAQVPFTDDAQDFFVPLRYAPDFWRNRRPHVLGTIARLRPGVSVEAANTALQTLGANVAREEPAFAGETFTIRPFREEVLGDVRFGLLMLMGTVGLVLLIAAANLGALFLLRTDDRRSELSVRAALGAARSRVIRQLFIESAAVTAVGAGVGIVVAHTGVALMQRMVPFQIPRLGDARIDVAVVLATVLLSAALAAAFGLLSAVGATRRNADRSLAGVRTTGRRGRARFQAAVVALQAGLAVIVLAGATLLVRSYAALRAVDPGFAATDAWMIRVGTSSPVLSRVLEEVRDMPGVAAAALAYDHPLERSWGDSFIIQGELPTDADDAAAAALRIVTDGWFDAAGIRILEGRAPDALEMASTRGVVVVNQALVDRYFTDGRVLGRRIAVPTGARMFGEGLPEWYEIVGIAANVRFLGPDREPEPALYLPAAQFPAGTDKLLVRPQPGYPNVFGDVREVIRSIDPDLPLQSAQRMDAILSDLLARPRFNMAVLAAFAAVGLMLAALGIYGLVSRVVVSRGREIGVRVALGASPGRLVRSLLAVALRPASAGALAGLALAAVLTSLLRSMLYGVSSNDPVTLVLAPGFVIVVALLASLLPTARALRIDPATTLRDD